METSCLQSKKSALEMCWKQHRGTTFRLKRPFTVCIALFTVSLLLESNFNLPCKQHVTAHFFTSQQAVVSCPAWWMAFEEYAHDITWETSSIVREFCQGSVVYSWKQQAVKYLITATIFFFSENENLKQSPMNPWTPVTSVSENICSC